MFFFCILYNLKFCTVMYINIILCLDSGLWTEIWTRFWTDAQFNDAISENKLQTLWTE